METLVGIRLLRDGGGSLSGQIFDGIQSSIVEGRLAPGTRLPSWNDLAVQLGVARGTVRAAYERLADAHLVISSGAAGTRVTGRPPITRVEPVQALSRELEGYYLAGETHGLPFQIGVPAADLFPRPLWARLIAEASRTCLSQPARYPDPRGEPGLRAEVAAYLSVARGISCHASQVFITNGFAGAMSIATRALRLHGKHGWVEDPGYPFARAALAWAGARAVAVPVDGAGLDVEAGIAAAPDASFALVTPGQQAPFGMTLPIDRRHALLDWAAAGDRWIIEDDYLGELQLSRRAAPALASMDQRRVMHIGSFSKTISPALRLGYLVVPAHVVQAVAQVVGTGDPSPPPLGQIAVEAFMRQGHYLRHLRRMKRAYGERREALVAALRSHGRMTEAGGLSVLVDLPRHVSDTSLAAAARAQGLSPVPLSPWYHNDDIRRSGLLLGVTNVLPAQAINLVAQLDQLIGKL